MTVKKRCREDSCTNTPHQNAQTGSCNVNTVKRSSPSASQRWDCLTFINLPANLTPRSVAFRPRHACITESSDLLPKIIQEVYSDWPVRKKRRWKHLSILGDAFPRLGTAFGSHDCENKQKTDRSLYSRPSWSKSYSKPVLLSFWASNSPFCRSSAQKFRHIHVGWRRNANDKS